MAGSKKNRTKSVWSSVLFAAGILLMAFSLIKGESAWLFIHNVLLGCFSFSAYIIPVIFIFVSVMIAVTDDETMNIQGKVLQCFVSVFLLSGAIQIIFSGELQGEDLFKDILPNLYEQGKELKGGGMFSILAAGVLLPLFQRVGASIIICLIIFVYIMILSDKTILDLWRWIRNGAKAFASLFSRPVSDEDDELPYEISAETKQNIQSDNFVPPPGAEKSKKPPKPDKKSALKIAEQQKQFDVDIPLPVSETITEDEELPFDITEPRSAALPKTAVLKSEPELAGKKDNAELSEIVKKAALEAEERRRRNPAVFEEKDLGTEKTKHSTLASNKITQEADMAILNAPTAADIQKEIDVKAAVVVYKFPPIGLLKQANNEINSESAEAEMSQNADTLVETLKSFGVQTRIVDIHRGPTVTRYEIQPSAGVKISKITNLSDDIALNLAAAGVRIEAPIPGKAAVGVEVPNKVKDIVSLRELIESSDFQSNKSKLSFVAGKNIDGEVIIGDIAKMPHVIIAGTTGSGKSVCTNSIIMSILYNASPDDVRMVLIDPKMVEFKTYDGIPHLLIPVVTDPRKAAGALSWAVQEMLKRYKLFADNNVRDLSGFNEMAAGIDGMETLPRIVIVIDELADLMMAAANEVEDSICRLAQMARAAGMHLIIATQRPTVDVITGLIKANIPSRIALTVSSSVDSRTIIDSAGAEKLLGNGDMLYFPSGVPKPMRLQGCYVSTKEVEAVVNFIKNGVEVEYSAEIIEEIEKNMPTVKIERITTTEEEPTDGDITDRAVECLIDAGQASVSYLQRKLKLGYARAARIMDDLEALGVVGPYEGAKPRAVLFTREQWMQRKLLNVDKTESQTSEIR
ncbi:MAG: DNA translocase FtsK [Ruminococcus sp.]|jgi:S-DNA-T family DNA segregation ATPase FtsK/SpoIIIE|nr:DNA translocase FtsK [Ruminococcus sp.]